MTDLPTAIGALPFVEATMGRPTRLWVVHSTGDYGADTATGRAYADALIGCMTEHDSPNLLGLVVKDIVQQGAPWTGIEVGFFHQVASRSS